MFGAFVFNQIASEELKHYLDSQTMTLVFTEVNINTKKSIQKTRNIPLYSRANWANIKDDLNKLHEDIIKMKDQKSNVNAMWTHF
jgi:hypothetical protein